MSTDTVQTEQKKPQKLDSWLHCISGGILMLYGASHFGFLKLHDVNHHLPNLVLPIFSNWTLYLFAGLTEMSIGILCLIMRGSGTANALILTFVAVMIWYRWAYYFAGGAYCGCLGLLGRLFHFNKTQETFVPIMTLVLLVLTTIPWLYRKFKNGSLRLARNISLAMIVFFSQKTQAVETIEIRGLTHQQDYNWANGAPIEEHQWNNSFVALISGDAWSVCITNLNRPRWWSEIVYDGSNTYLIQPYSQYGKYATNNNQVPDTSLQEVMIDSSARFLQRSDEMDMDIGWLTYGLSKSAVHSNKMGLVEMPLPTAGARDNPRSFGYKWLINFTEDGRYATDLKIIRDNKLDLTDRGELLRPELDYPETQATYNEYMQLIAVNRSTPSGFVKCKYECSAWQSVNGKPVPTESQLEAYWWDIKRGIGRFPWHIVTLRATNWTTRAEVKNLLPEIMMPTKVQDYRFKKANESRIFKYAGYSLNPGDVWRSENDSTLLKEAEEYLKHGRKYTQWTNRGRQWIIWSLLAILIAPVMIMLYKNTTKGNK